MTTLTLITMAAVGLLAAAAGAADADVFEPSAADVDRVTRMLAPEPGGFAPPATDRSAWSPIARRSDVKGEIARAEGMLGKPIPEMTDDLYLDYSRTGNRDRGQAVMFERRTFVRAHAMAESLEGKGRFLAALDEAIRGVCGEKSWTMPAHDGNLQSFSGKLITVDLAAAALAADLATIDSVLGLRLPAETRAIIRRELKRRIFDPYRAMIAAKQSQYWLTYTHNWNAVCLNGVTTAALNIVDDPKERAWFVLVSEHYSRNSLKGFTPDGYCDEGVGYWNYGYGNYASLAEAVRRATRDGVDLLNRREAVMPSAYGARVPIVPGICPAFADCDVHASPSAGLVDYLSRRFTGKGALPRRASMGAGFCDTLMAFFPTDAPVLRPGVAWPRADPLRAWFPDETVLVSRPAPRSTCKLAVAIQGGHNAQNHNHNDVGVFMVVVGKTAVLADIGAEVYTQRTFGARRYESKALNSWGHAVPVIAGELQRAGRQAQAKLLKADFGPNRDELSLDIRSAYAVPELTTLERAYVYDRTGDGSLTVTDTFAFTEPQTFETALLTFGTWERTGPTTLRIADGREAVTVEIEAPSGAELVVSAEEVKEDLTARRNATRIGIRLSKPLLGGTVRLVVRPG